MSNSISMHFAEDRKPAGSCLLLYPDGYRVYSRQIVRSLDAVKSLHDDNPALPIGVFDSFVCGPATELWYWLPE